MHKFTLEKVTCKSVSSKAANQRTADDLLLAVITDNTHREPDSPRLELAAGESAEAGNECPFGNEIRLELYQWPASGNQTGSPLAVDKVTLSSGAGPVTLSGGTNGRPEYEVSYSLTTNAFSNPPVDTVRNAIEQFKNSSTSGQWVELGEETVKTWIEHIAKREMDDEGPPWKFALQYVPLGQRNIFKNVDDVYETQQGNLGYCVPASVEFWTNFLHPRRFVTACQSIWERGLMVGRTRVLRASRGLLRSPSPTRKEYNIFDKICNQTYNTPEGDWMFMSFLEDNDDLWKSVKMNWADGPITELSLSLATAADGNATAYAADDDHAIAVTVPGSGSTDPAITGTVDATVSDGFQMAFERTADDALVVQYRAVAVHDDAAIRVGHFTTDAVSSAPHTQTVPVDGGAPGGPPGSSLPAFDPDHVLLTATNVIAAPDTAGSQSSGPGGGSLAGFCHGEAVDTGSTIDQQAITEATDPTDDAAGTSHAVGFSGDAALELLYGEGDDVAAATTARVTRIERPNGGRPEIDLEFQAQPSGTSIAGHPQVVTYVAMESPSVTEPVPRTHRPTVGYAAAPVTEGETVTLDPGFEPASVELTVCPGITVPPDTTDDNQGSPLSIRTTSSGASGWSHGVASDPTDQRVLGQGVRTVASESSPTTYHDATAAVGTGTDAVAVTYLDDEGGIAGRTVGRITGMDADGIDIEFPSLYLPGGSDPPLVCYRAWPATPEATPYAVETSLSLQELDLSPLDAVSLSQVDAQPGLSQLERRIRYELFRDRPDHYPTIPDGATVELTFADTGTDRDDAVSVATYLEIARSIRELLSEARPADAEDLAHPSEAEGPGYLPAGSLDESDSAAELRTRADAVRGKLDDAETILADRRAVFDVPDDERTLPEQTAAIDDAIKRFGYGVPARQLHEVADRLPNLHYSGTGERLADELRTLRDRLAAGPTDRSTLSDDVVVETAVNQSVTFETDLSGGTAVDLAFRSHSPSSHFRGWFPTVTTDADGRVQAELDARNVVPGTRFTVVGRLTNQPPLSTVFERELRDLDPAHLEDLYEAVRNAEILDDEEREAVEEYLEDSEERVFIELPTDKQIALFQLLDRDTKVEILEEIGERVLAERYAGTDSGPEIVATGRVVAANPDSRPSVPETISTSLDLVPRLLWLDRVVERIRPTNAGEPGRTRPHLREERHAALGGTIWRRHVAPANRPGPRQAPAASRGTDLRGHHGPGCRRRHDAD